MANIIKFESSCHWYACRDCTPEPQHDADLRVARKQLLYPSVTTIDKDEFKNDFLEKWKMNELVIAAAQYQKMPHETDEDYCNRIYQASLEKAKTAAEFGKGLHDAIEHYPQMPLDPGLTPWMDKFGEWYSQHVDYPLHREKIVFDHDLGVAGRCDFIGVGKGPFAGQRIIPDWKGLEMQTPLATPTGWTTIGEVMVGDQVLSESGEPVTVVGKGPVFNKRCYKITFDDTSEIICDCDHLWKVHHGFGSNKKKIEVLGSDELYHRHKTRKKGYHFTIPNAEPLTLPFQELGFDPYLLGVWLGDGSESEGKVTLGEKKKRIVEYISSLGFEIEEFRPCNYYVKRLATELKKIGVFGKKHVPVKFLRSSESQRLALLRGLMDTDGSWNKGRKQANFVSTNKGLAESVYELVVSLGCRASLHTHTAKGFGTTCIAHTVHFTPNGFNPFYLNSFNWPEAEPHKNGSSQCKRRLIKSMVEIESVPTQCIAVDSEDHMYLAGRQMVPTHNTQNVKKDDKGRKKPAFYDSWPRQLAFYAVCDAKESGTFPQLPTCISVVIDSNEPCAPFVKVWSKDEILSSYEDFVIAAYRWFKKKKYFPQPNGMFRVSPSLKMP